jgi:cell division protein FtsZ
MGVRQMGMTKLRKTERASKDDEEIISLLQERSTKIKVVGCGGAGNNTITRLLEVGITGAETIAINTDAQACFTPILTRRFL